MSSNTRLSGVLASCRIIILCMTALYATPAISEENGVIEVTDAIPFRDLNYNDDQNKSHKLRADLGKLTLVHFWATWCVPCVAELPKLDAFQKKYENQGLKVISISEDGEKKMSAVKEFFKKNSIQTLIPYLDINNNAFNETKTRGLPTTYFVDSNGQKIAVAEGPVEWDGETATAFLKLHLKANQ